MKISENNTRERLLAFVTTLRQTLAVNPHASLSAVCTLATIGKREAQRIVELGVISVLPSGGHKWESKASDGEIVDMMIEHRRRESAPAAVVMNAESFAQIETQFRAIGEVHVRFAERLDTLEKRKASPELSAEDRELLNLVLTDKDNYRARLDQLEANVGQLLLRTSHLAQPATPASLGVLHGAAPAQRPREVKIALVGVHQRDIDHVVRASRDMIGDAAVFRCVHINRIDHQSHQKMPTDADAIIVTSNASGRVKEAQAACRNTHVLASSGNSTVAAQIATIVRGISLK